MLSLEIRSTNIIDCVVHKNHMRYTYTYFLGKMRLTVETDEAGLESVRRLAASSGVEFILVDKVLVPASTKDVLARNGWQIVDHKRFIIVTKDGFASGKAAEFIAETLYRKGS